MGTGKALNGKPYAGNPHVRFDEGAGASRHSGRSALLYKRNEMIVGKARRIAASLAAALSAAICAVATSAATAAVSNLESYHFRQDFSTGEHVFIGGARYPVNNFGLGANGTDCAVEGPNGPSSARHVGNLYSKEGFKIDNVAVDTHYLDTNDWTVAMSFRPGNVEKGIIYTIGRLAGGDNSGQITIGVCSSSDPSKLYVQEFYRGSDSTPKLGSTATLTGLGNVTKGFHTLVLVYSQSTHKITTYFDGVSKGTLTLTTTRKLGGSNKTCRIGNYIYYGIFPSLSAMPSGFSTSYDNTDVAFYDVRFYLGTFSDADATAYAALYPADRMGSPFRPSAYVEASATNTSANASVGNYIDTGYTAQKGSEFAVDFQFLDKGTVQQRIFGLYDGTTKSNTDSSDGLLHALYVNGSTQFAFARHTTFVSGGSWIGMGVALDQERRVFTLKNKDATDSGSVGTLYPYGDIASATVVTNARNHTKNAVRTTYLFADNKSNAPSNFGKARIYSFEADEDGTPVLFLAPDMQNGEAGFRNIIDGSFKGDGNKDNNPERTLRFYDGIGRASDYKYESNTLYAKAYLTVAEAGTGSVAPTAGGEAWIPRGGTLSVTATPATGYKVKSWECSPSTALTSSDGATATLAGDYPAQLRATFELIEATATSADSAMGKVKINNGTTAATAAENIPVNGTVTITAVPEEGYSFAGWTGDTSAIVVPGDAKSFKIKVSATADVTLTATFVADSTTLAADTAVDAFVQSYGKNAIDTGYKANQDSQFRVDFALDANSKQSRIFGTYRPSSPTAGDLDTSLYINGSFYFAFVMSCVNKGHWKSTGMAADLDRHIFTLKATSSTQVEGSIYAYDAPTIRQNSDYTDSNVTLTTPSTRNIFLFSTAAANIDSNDTFSKAKIYSFDIVENGNNLALFVPDTNSAGAAGFRDMVTGEFHGESATTAPATALAFNAGLGSAADYKNVDGTVQSRLYVESADSAKGSVAIDDGTSGASASKFIDWGGTATLTATPAEGYGFRRWTGATWLITSGTERSATITVTANHAALLKAEFTEGVEVDVAIGDSDTYTDFDGLFAEGGTLVKTGAGALTVYPANTYGGKFTVTGDATMKFAETNGAVLASLSLDAGARLALDPVRHPMRLNSTPVFGTGATLALDSAYSATTRGRFVLMTWTGESVSAPAFDSSSVAGSAAVSVATAPDGVSRQLILTVGDYDENAPELRVMPIGDSITQGHVKDGYGRCAQYRTTLAAHLAASGYKPVFSGIWKTNQVDLAGVQAPEAWAWHYGISGDAVVTDPHCGGVIDNLHLYLDVAGEPDVVTLLIGTNDLGQNGKAADVVYPTWTNLVWEIARRRPNAKIVASTILPRNQSSNNTKVTALNASIREAYNGGHLPANLTLVDTADGFQTAWLASDGTHPMWQGCAAIAESFAGGIASALPAASFTGTTDATITSEPQTALGAASIDELAAWRGGFVKAYEIDAPEASSFSAAPYTWSNGELASDLRVAKVGYYMELVRKGTNRRRWVWVDMDATGKTLDDVDFPWNETAGRQYVATKLHVASSDFSIHEVAPTDDTVSGVVEMSPLNVTRSRGMADVAPNTMTGVWGWNDKMSTSGNYGCFQVHRLFSQTGTDVHWLDGEVLLAWNRWGGGNGSSSSSVDEIGIGTYACHAHPLYSGSNYMGSMDYTYTATGIHGLVDRVTAAAYQVRRVEIWIMPDTIWTNADGTGSFSAAANWSSGEMPGEGRSFTMSLHGDTTVRLDSAYVLGNVQVEGTGSVDFGGEGSLTVAKVLLTNGVSFAACGRVTAAGIDLPTGSAATLTTLDGIDAGGVTGVGTLVLAPGAAESVTISGLSSFTGDFGVTPDHSMTGTLTCAATSLNKFTLNGTTNVVFTLVNGTGGSFKAKEVVVVDGVLQQGSASVLSTTPKLTVRDGGTFDINRLKIEDATKPYIAGAGAGDWPWAICSSAGSMVSGNYLANITLQADATIGGPGQLKIGASSSSENKIVLNDHKLTLAGTKSATFRNLNTDAGTIELAPGYIVTLNSFHNLNSNKSKYSGTTLIIRNGARVVNQTDRVIYAATVQLDGGNIWAGGDDKKAFGPLSTLSGHGMIHKLVMPEGAAYKPDGLDYLNVTESLSGTMKLGLSEFNLENENEIKLVKVPVALTNSVNISNVPDGWRLRHTADGDNVNFSVVKVLALELNQRATGETQGVEVEATDALLTNIGLSTTATPSEVNDFLNASDPNGLRRWENLVTGTATNQPPLGMVSAETASGKALKLSVKMVADTNGIEKVGLGYEVLRELRKGDGTRVAGPSPDGTAFDIELLNSEGTSSGASGLYRVVTLLAYGSVTNEIPSTNAVGIVEVASTATNTITAVPWKRLASAPGEASDLTVSNFVAYANLSDGDAVYMLDGRAYKMWKKINGKWEAATTVSGSDTSISIKEAGAPDVATIPCGGAVWVQRTDATKPYFLVGQYDESAFSVTVPGSGAALIANPFPTNVTLNAINWGTSVANDIIRIPRNGSNVELLYDNTEKKWGYYTEAVIEGPFFMGFTEKSFVPYNEPIPVGTGFIYVRGVGEDFTFEWK